jgi:hypothetical protein
MPFDSDYVEEMIQMWYGNRVQCVLLCTILETPYYPVFAPSNRGQTYKRISIRDTNNSEKKTGLTKAMVK